ncbi:MAG: acyl-CoA thioesterase [Limisphaerales bacterium]|nr:thioesterase family protein [Verrucomicrobiota bacterium]
MNKDNQSVFFDHTIQLRVRYSETDQMGTFYNSRALEWFECGRTEVLRALGIPYSTMEIEGVFLPVIEAHIEYLDRAEYDDLLELTTRILFQGRAKFRAEELLVNTVTKRVIVRGYTVHAFVNVNGNAIRPPQWLVESFYKAIAEKKLEEKNKCSQ